MLDLGWSEILLVAVIALIVVGPQDFPRLLRTVGQWVGRARQMMAQVQYAVNEAAAETDIKPSDWTKPAAPSNNFAAPDAAETAPPVDQSSGDHPPADHSSIDPTQKAQRDD